MQQVTYVKLVLGTGAHQLIYKGLHFARRHIGDIISSTHNNGPWLNSLENRGK